MIAPEVVPVTDGHRRLIHLGGDRRVCRPEVIRSRFKLRRWNLVDVMQSVTTLCNGRPVWSCVYMLSRHPSTSTVGNRIQWDYHTAHNAEEEM
jgi:hypothetical protein